MSDKNAQLDVTWNRKAAPIETAQRGVLSIADGPTKRDLELTGAQLRDGRVLYARLSGDVNLRLEVFPAGRPSVSESIRIVSMDGPPQVRATPVQPPVALGAESPAAPKKKTAWTRSTAPVTRQAAPAVTTSFQPPPKVTPAPAPAPPMEAPPEIELQRPARRR